MTSSNKNLRIKIDDLTNENEILKNMIIQMNEYSYKNAQNATINAENSKYNLEFSEFITKHYFKN
jgi:hypothetical protein